MEKETPRGLIWTILVLSVLSVLFTGMMVFSPKAVPNPEVTLKDKQDIANMVLTNLPEPKTPEVIVPPAELSAEDKAYLKSASNLDEKQKAEALALDELTTKDFKKVLVESLNDEDTNIESYKDINKVVVKDTEVNVNGEDGNVEFTLRVYYFEDGDDEESDLESARVKFTFEVSDLNADEEFSDAEVVDYSSDNFELVKFYEK